MQIISPVHIENTLVQKQRKNITILQNTCVMCDEFIVLHSKQVQLVYCHKSLFKTNYVMFDYLTYMFT